MTPSSPTRRSSDLEHVAVADDPEQHERQDREDERELNGGRTALVPLLASPNPSLGRNHHVVHPGTVKGTDPADPRRSRLSGNDRSVPGSPKPDRSNRTRPPGPDHQGGVRASAARSQTQRAPRRSHP